MTDESRGFLSKTPLTQPYNSQVGSMRTEPIWIMNALPQLFVTALNFKIFEQNIEVNVYFLSQSVNLFFRNMTLNDKEKNTATGHTGSVTL